jgi:WD40 repeat protein
VWSAKESGILYTTLRNHLGPITCLKLEGKTLISGSEDKTVRIWDLTDIIPAKSANGAVTDATFTRRRAVSAVVKQTIAPLTRTLHGHTSTVKSLDFFDQVIVSGDIRGQIRLWHLER